MKGNVILIMVCKHASRLFLSLMVFFFSSVILSGFIEPIIPAKWVDVLQDYGSFMQGSEGYYDALELLGVIFTLPGSLLLTWLIYRISGRLPFLRP